MFDLTLSFDNGPEPGVTPGVLDLLARERILTTFFVLGDKLADPTRRRLAEQAHAQGHWIGNHTMHHVVPLGDAGDPQAAAEEEIDGCQALLGELSHPDRLFRPFGRGGLLGPHLLSTPALERLRNGRHTMVLWNSIPRDFADPEGWVATALEQCQQQPWTLMVLHDLPNGAMNHLPRFIEAARAAGARFRQDFPPSCTPLVRGEITGPIDTFVRRPAV